MNAVFLVREGGSSLDELRAQFERAGLSVETAAFDRLFVSRAGGDHLWVGVLVEMDSSFAGWLAEIEPNHVLEVEYSSLSLLHQALSSLNPELGTRIDNDHGFEGSLTDLLELMNTHPGWDWRLDPETPRR
jgi:hypothetical protein